MGGLSPPLKKGLACTDFSTGACIIFGGAPSQPVDLASMTAPSGAAVHVLHSVEDKEIFDERFTGLVAEAGDVESALAVGDNQTQSILNKSGPELEKARAKLLERKKELAKAQKDMIGLRAEAQKEELTLRQHEETMLDLSTSLGRLASDVIYMRNRNNIMLGLGMCEEGRRKGEEEV